MGNMEYVAWKTGLAYDIDEVMLEVALLGGDDEFRDKGLSGCHRWPAWGAAKNPGGSKMPRVLTGTLCLAELTPFMP